MKELNDVLYNFDLDNSSYSLEDCMDFVCKLSKNRLLFGLLCMIFDIDFYSDDRKLTFKEYQNLDALISYIKWGEDEGEHNLDVYFKK